MAKNSIRDFDATSSNNTDIQSVDISEGCSPAGINNAIRELMADIKDVSAGTVALESPQADSLTVTGEILAGTDTGDAFNAHAKLRVQKADHAYLQIKSANTKQAGVLLGDTDDDFVGGMIYDNSTNHLQFNSGDAERMRIDSSGNLLVGTTGLPSLTNKGTALRPVSLDRTIIQMSSASVSTGVELIQFRNPNGQVGFIATNANSTTYSTSSDYRLKENVTEITDGIERVKKLNPSRFNFIADADVTVDGFLAHAVSDIVPEAITGEKDGMIDEEYEASPAVLDDDGNVVKEAVMEKRSVPYYQGIDQSKLVPLLTAALQEAVAKIEALETRVATLEG